MVSSVRMMIMDQVLNMSLVMMRMRIAMMAMTRIGGVVTPKVNPPPRQAGKGKMIILIVIITIPIKMLGWYFDDS